MRDRANEVAPSCLGAANSKIRPGAHFRHGAISRSDPSTAWSRPIVQLPARALPRLEQHPGQALPVDSLSRQPVSIPPARIVQSPAEAALPVLVAAQDRPLAPRRRPLRPYLKSSPPVQSAAVFQRVPSPARPPVPAFPEN